MKFKQLGAFLIAAVMMSGLMVGCGDKEKTGSGSSKSDEKVQDMGGYEFTWMSLYPSSLYPEAGSTDYGDRLLERYEQVEKTYNCKITLVESSPETIMDDINRAALSGEKLADFIQIDYMRYNLVENAGTFRPLSTITGFDPKKEYFLKNVSDVFTEEDGKIYGVNFNLSTISKGVVMIYNKTLLQKEKCQDPYELWKGDKWTFDKFEEICKKITKKKDGKTVQWGFATADWATNNCEKPFIFANGGSVLKKNAENKYEFALLDEPAQYALSYLNRIELQEGYFKPSRSDAYANLDALIGEGNVGFFIDQPSVMVERASSNMEDDWGLVPLPKGPNATGYTSVTYQPSAFFMLAANKDAEKAAYIFDKIARPLYGSAAEDENSYLDEYKNTYLKGDDKIMEVYKFASSPVVDPSWILPQPDLISNAIYSCVRSTSTTPKAAMEAISAVVTANILSGFYGIVPEA